MSVQVLKTQPDDSGNWIEILSCSTTDVAFGPLHPMHDEDEEEGLGAFVAWLPMDPRTYSDSELRWKYYDWKVEAPVRAKAARELAEFFRHLEDAINEPIKTQHDCEWPEVVAPEGVDPQVGADWLDENAGDRIRVLATETGLQVSGFNSWSGFDANEPPAWRIDIIRADACPPVKP